MSLKSVLGDRIYHRVSNRAAGASKPLILRAEISSLPKVAVELLQKLSNEAMHAQHLSGSCDAPRHTLVWYFNGNRASITFDTPSITKSLAMLLDMIESNGRPATRLPLSCTWCKVAHKEGRQCYCMSEGARCHPHAPTRSGSASAHQYEPLRIGHQIVADEKSQNGHGTDLGFGRTHKECRG